MLDPSGRCPDVASIGTEVARQVLLQTYELLPPRLLLDSVVHRLLSRVDKQCRQFGIAGSDTRRDLT